MRFLFSIFVGKRIEKRLDNMSGRHGLPIAMRKPSEDRAQA